MGSQLHDRVSRWATAAGVGPALVPQAAELAARFGGLPDPCREPAGPRDVDGWEERHGYILPVALRAWLEVSNGFYVNGPLIHPLAAIGPMVPFARVPDLVVQPESWFELGNPNVETVCIDLAYWWPGGGPPVFTSGDDETGSPLKVIAPSFQSWFLGVLRHGGREFWFEPGFPDLGDPWEAHRRHAPKPPLPPRLRRLTPHVLPLMRPGADERSIALRLGISRGDVELIFRHLQHGMKN